jgi:hypothetical protein
MKTTTRLLLVFAAPLLTAAPASAWHCHRAGMMTMPMMPMPMMGVGTLPVGGALPIGGVLPTTLAGGGVQMSFQMSGDPAMLLLMPGLIRNLLGSFLGVSGTGGLTDAQFQALADRIRGLAVTAGANPMTAQQAETLITELRQLRLQFQQRRSSGKDVPVLPPPKEDKEMTQARAVVQRLVAEEQTRRTAAAPRDLQQARAEVRKLVAAGAARPAPQGSSDLEQARAVVRQLVAEGAGRQTGRARPAGVNVAGGAK